QARGEAVNRRSDVYALGIVLWEMLTMRSFFHEDSDAALLRVVRSPPPPVAPSRFAPDVPPSLDATVLAALSPNPADRPPTAQASRGRGAPALPRARALGPNPPWRPRAAGRPRSRGGRGAGGAGEPAPGAPRRAPPRGPRGPHPATLPTG